MVVSFQSVPAPKICLAALITLGTSQRFLTSEKLRPASRGSGSAHVAASKFPLRKRPLLGMFAEGSARRKLARELRATQGLRSGDLAPFVTDKVLVDLVPVHVVPTHDFSGPRPASAIAANPTTPAWPIVEHLMMA
jgi:hypothetical protein